MRLTRRSAMTRTVLLALAVVMVIGLFAGPSFAAGDRTQFIRTHEQFGSSRLCSDSGWFEASGTITTTGRARSCAQRTYAPGIAQGTTQLHNGDDLTVHWKVQCKLNEGDRFRHFDCRGQWWVDGPNWTGGGNSRHIFNLETNELTTTSNGKLSPA